MMRKSIIEREKQLIFHFLIFGVTIINNAENEM